MLGFKFLFNPWKCVCSCKTTKVFIPIIIWLGELKVPIGGREAVKHDLQTLIIGFSVITIVTQPTYGKNLEKTTQASTYMYLFIYFDGEKKMNQMRH